MEKQQKNQKKPQNNNKGGGLSDYARYSGLAFEMIVIITAAAFGGVKLDELVGTKSLFTVVLSLFGVGASIYIVLKGLISRNK